MDIEVAKNIAKALGVSDDQLEKLGTTELPVEAILNSYKQKVIESDALNSEKVKAELEEARRKGMMAAKGMVDEMLSDDEGKKYWMSIKDDDKIDPQDRIKLFLAFIKKQNEKTVEAERAKSTKDANEWRENFETEKQRAEKEQAEREKLLNEVIPNMKTDMELTIKAKELEAKVWLEYTTANIDFKTPIKRMQDFDIYKGIISKSYDLKDSSDGSIILFKKGTSETAIDAAGKTLTLKAALEQIAEARGERVMSKPTETAPGKKPAAMSEDEARRRARTERYGGSVGLS